MLCSPLAVQPSLFTQFFVINCRVRNKVKHIQTVLGDWLQKFKNTFISSRARPRYAERLRDKQYFRINFRIRELTWRTFPVRQALHFPWALAISQRFIITKVTRHHCCKVSFYHYGEGFNKLIFKQEGIRIWQPGRKSTKLVVWWHAPRKIGNSTLVEMGFPVIQIYHLPMVFFVILSYLKLISCRTLVFSMHQWAGLPTIWR